MYKRMQFLIKIWLILLEKDKKRQKLIRDSIKIGNTFLGTQVM